MDDILMPFAESTVQLNVQSLPHFVCAALVLALLLRLLYSEGLTRVSLALTQLSGAIFLWLFCFALMYSSRDARTALWWAKASYLGIPFIPSALYHFVVAVLNLDQAHKRLVRLGWCIAGGCMLFIIGTGRVITGMRSFPWGWYPQYGPLSVPYLLFFMLFLGMSLRLLLRGYALANPGSLQYRRIRSLLAACLVASISLIDYLPKFGIDVYPPGYLAIFVSLIIFNRTIKKYRLVDITPKFAAQGIIDTMNDALLVYDPEGIVRLTNHAAVSLFGMAQDDMRDRHITWIIGADIVFHPDLFIRDRSLSQRELACTNTQGRQLTLSISVSRLMDESGSLQAFILVARDISEQKRAEDALRRAHDELEIKVRERTADLQSSNESLSVEIAERKHVEQKLMASEERYRLLTETSPNAITAADLSGTIIMLNNRALSLYGHRDPSEVLGRSILDWVPVEQREVVLTKFAEVCSGHDVNDLELVLFKSNGEQFWASVNASPARDHEGRPQFVIIVSTDITERRRAEESLKGTLSLMKATLESTADGILVVDSEGRINSFNEQFVRLWDIPPDILASRDDGRALQFVLDQLKEPAQFLDKVRLLYLEPDASSFDVLEFKDSRVIERYSLPQRIDGSPVGRVWSFRDVTEQRRSAATIERLHADLAATLQAIPDLLFELDRDGRYLNVWAHNPNLLMRQKEMLLGNTVAEMLPPDAAETVFSSIHEADTKGVSFGRVIRLTLPEGERWFELSTARKEVVGEFGRKFIMLSRDITDRQHAEERIRRSEEFVRSILDTVDEGIIVIDRDYRILTGNRAYCRQVGREHEGVVGHRCYEISHHATRPCHEDGEECAVRDAFLDGMSRAVVHRHRSPDGGILFVETRAYPMRDESGSVISVIETITNITERHLLAEERLKTQKLESIGTLAGGIAHDFNNLLQGVFGYISLAQLSFDQKDKSLAMLKQAEEALHLAVGLTTQLLTFAKGGQPVKKLMTLQPAIENAVKFALSGSQSDYAIEAGSDLWCVEADEGQLSQVIQNIVLNANEAMAGSGTVTVSLENVTLPADAVSGLPKGGAFVRIAIRDDGIGIPRQNLSRIFDPYFTTKQKGSGLGLATSYSIVRNHGGDIEVQTELSKGSTFSIYLPAASCGETLPETYRLVPEGRAAGRVLFMDDEELMRSVAAEMIGALGHEVSVVPEGGRAVELFRQAKEEGRPFSVVILDLTVKGGMGGEETIGELLRIDPGVVAVVSSGYADNEVVAHYRDYGFSAVLNKPYRIEALRDCLHSLL